MIDISVIVITYNTRLDLLKACFDSVYASKDIDVELIVVDNGKILGLEGLLKAYEGSQYVRNEYNVGFAKAVNQGIERSKGEYIVLVNPDVQFDSDILLKMKNHLDRDTDVEIASCRMHYRSGELQRSIRRFPTFKDQVEIMLKVPHFRKTDANSSYLMLDSNLHETQDVDSIMGAFMWMRRSIVERIGGFDPRFFLWFEEVDYCKRAVDAGATIRHYGDIVITHVKGHDFSKIPTFRKQKWMRSSLRKYAFKHFALHEWAFLWLLTPLFILISLIASIIKPK